MEERLYSSRLKKVGELLDQDVVSREEVVSELGRWTSADHGAEGAAGIIELLFVGRLARLCTWYLQP